MKRENIYWKKFRNHTEEGLEETQREKIEGRNGVIIISKVKINN